MTNKAKAKPVVIVIVAGLAILVGAVALKYLSNQSSMPSPRGGMPAIPVVTARVGPIEFANSVEAIGTARANESVDVMSRVTDTISRIAFQDAGQVKAGDILVELTTGLVEFAKIGALSTFVEGSFDAVNGFAQVCRTLHLQSFVAIFANASDMLDAREVYARKAGDYTLAAELEQFSAEFHCIADTYRATLRARLAA